jgi:hypothetical protein
MIRRIICEGTGYGLALEQSGHRIATGGRSPPKPDLSGKPRFVSFSPRACSPDYKRNHFFRD